MAPEFILIAKDDDKISTSNVAHLHYCGVFYRMWMFQVAPMRKGVARIKGIPYVRIIMRNEKTSAKLLKPPDRDKLFGKGISFLAAELGLGPRQRCSSPHTFPHSTSHGCCRLQAAGCSTDDISSAPSLCRRRATFNSAKSANG